MRNARIYYSSLLAHKELVYCLQINAASLIPRRKQPDRSAPTPIKFGFSSQITHTDKSLACTQHGTRDVIERVRYWKPSRFTAYKGQFAGTWNLMHTLAANARQKMGGDLQMFVSVLTWRMHKCISHKGVWSARRSWKQNFSTDLHF